MSCLFYDLVFAWLFVCLFVCVVSVCLFDCSLIVCVFIWLLRDRFLAFVECLFYCLFVGLLGMACLFYVCSFVCLLGCLSACLFA